MQNLIETRSVASEVKNFETWSETISLTCIRFAC
jgi:hypothetical protein